MSKPKNWGALFGRALSWSGTPGRKETPLGKAFRRTIRRALLSILFGAIVLAVILVVRALTEGE